MSKPIQFLVALFAFLSPLYGDGITARVFRLSEVNEPSEVLRSIDDSMRPLILELQMPQNNDFIATTDASPTMKWRLSKFIIISDEMLAVTFDEGHVIVTGILVLNRSKKQWELTTSLGGEFKTKFYDESTGKPKQGEQGVAAEPDRAGG